LFGEVGELCAERYKLLLDGRVRIEGSDRLAIAFEVLSRANAAKVNSALLFCFSELVEGDDWRCLKLLIWRFEMSFRIGPAAEASTRAGED
jgi:hypothetical protein